MGMCLLFCSLRIIYPYDLRGNQILCRRLAILYAIENGINDVGAVYPFEPPILRLYHHDRTGFTLLEAGGSGDQAVETAIKNLFLNILEETIGLLVAETFFIARYPKTLADKDLSFWDCHFISFLSLKKLIYRPLFKPPKQTFTCGTFSFF